MLLAMPVTPARQTSLQSLLLGNWVPAATRKGRRQRPSTPLHQHTRRRKQFRPVDWSKNSSPICITDVQFEITSFLTVEECWVFSRTCRSASKDVAFKAGSKFVRQRQIFDWPQRLDLLPLFTNLRKLILHDVLTLFDDDVKSVFNAPVALPQQQQQQQQQESERDNDRMEDDDFVAPPPPPPAWNTNGCLRSLQVRHCCRDVSRPLFDLLLKNCQHLQSVDISHCRDVKSNDSMVLNDIAHLPRLSKLSMAHTEFSVDDVAAMMIDAPWKPRLQHLDISGLEDVDGGGGGGPPHLLTDAVGGMRALRSFALGGIGPFEANSDCSKWVHQLDISRKRRMLDINDGVGSAATDRLVEQLAHNCPLLVRLSLTFTRLLTDASALTLATRFPKLTHLALVDCPGVTDLGLKSIMKSEHLQQRKFQRLELLNTATDCSDELARLIGVSHGRYLEHLSISCSQKVMQDRLLCLTPMLTSLIWKSPSDNNRRRCPVLDVADMVWSQLTRLHTLCLWNWTLQFDTIMSLCKLLPELKLVVLSACSFSFSPYATQQLQEQFRHVAFVVLL